MNMTRFATTQRTHTEIAGILAIIILRLGLCGGP